MCEQAIMPCRQLFFHISLGSAEQRTREREGSNKKASQSLDLICINVHKHCSISGSLVDIVCVH